MLPAQLRRDRQGAVSIMFAGAAVPLIGLLGLAIDYAFVTQASTQLRLAAETAAISSIKIASNEFANQGASSNYQADGQTNGLQWFQEQAGGIPDASVKSYTVAVNRNVTQFTSQVTYTASVPTFFSSIMGYTHFNIGGSTGATITLNDYINIAMLLDNSSSMLIGATTTDINTMQSITPCSAESSNSQQGMGAWTGPTPTGCTTTYTWVASGSPSPGTPTAGKAAVAAPCGFACHWSNDNQTYKGNPDYTQYDYFYLARNPPTGVTKPTLRFDVVQSATAQVIQAMASSEVIPNQFGLSVFEFNSALTKVYPGPLTGIEAGYDLQGDSGSGLTAVTNITTPVVSNNGDTDFPDAMTTLATQLTAGGDGSSSVSPRKNLFIVTDGIQDYGSRTLGDTEGPFSNAAAIAACNKITSMGIAIYVLYTPYTPLPYNPYYVSNINQYVTSPPAPTDVVTALQNCSSSPNSNVYEADSPAQIAADETMLNRHLGVF